LPFENGVAMRFVIATLALITTATSGFAAEAAAPDTCAGPCLIYDGTADLSAEWLNPSDPTISKSRLFLPTTESIFEFKANDSFSLLADIITEQVIDPVPGENQIFRGLGTYVYELRAQYNFDGGSIWAGKIHPRFGRAWDITPGIHGTDLAENYELAERLGWGSYLDFEAAGLANRFEASAFAKDRTVLSESLFNKRPRTVLSDGGAGNTKGISSLALSLDGCLGADVDSCYDDGSFGYQVATRYQRGGIGSVKNELGFVGGLNTSFPLGEDAALKFFAETGWFRNYDGGPDNMRAFTGSGALEVGDVTLSVAYSQQKVFVVDDVNTTEHFVDVTAMYDLGDKLSLAGETWSVGAGYTYDKAEGFNVQTVGLKLSTAFSTKVPLGH
jgi:hypothetical protein